MLRFIIKRLLLIIPVMFGVVLIVFTVNRLSPGDPVMLLLGDGYTQEQYDAKEAELGLDKPFVVQLGSYIYGVVTRLDLGRSYATNTSVSTEIFRRLPTSFKFALLGCLITAGLGIPFGIICATKQYSIYDKSVTIFSLIFASVPGFWLGLMMIIIFSLNLKWLPASVAGNMGAGWKAWILPILTVGLHPVASTTRLTRSSMLDVTRQDYVRTARAKGLSERKVIWHHELKNALIPIITSLGMQLAGLVGGSVVAETIFSIPGLGTLITSAISGYDYVTIQGCVLVLSFFVCLINLVTDLVYGFVDPRIMAQYKSASKKKKTSQVKPAEKSVSGGVA